MLDGSLVSQTQGLEPSQFSSPVLGKIYGILLGHLSQGRSLQLGALEGELEGEEITLLAHIFGHGTQRRRHDRLPRGDRAGSHAAAEYQRRSGAFGRA